MPTWIPIAEAARKSALHATTLWRWTRRGGPGGEPLVASRIRPSRESGRRWAWVVWWQDVAAVLADPSLRPRPTGRPPREGPPTTCRARGCGKPVLTAKGGGKGWCATHYQRRRRARLRRDTKR